jgi:hypothetical protein
MTGEGASNPKFPSSSFVSYKDQNQFWNNLRASHSFVKCIEYCKLYECGDTMQTVHVRPPRDLEKLQRLVSSIVPATSNLIEQELRDIKRIVHIMQNPETICNRPTQLRVTRMHGSKPSTYVYPFNVTICASHASHFSRKDDRKHYSFNEKLTFDS